MLKKLIGFLAALLITPVIGRAAPVTQAPIYQDVNEAHWGYDYIMEASVKGWFEGDGTGNFRPDDEITREEVAKLMAKATGNTRNLYYPKTDIEGRWSESYINQVGYMFLNTENLTLESEFRPCDTITREEAMLAFVIGYQHVDKTVTEGELTNFIDLETINEASEDFARICVELGIINGKSMGDGTQKISGQDGLTRAEFATMLVRAENVGQGEAYAKPTEPEIEIEITTQYNLPVVTVKGDFDELPSPYSKTLVGNVTAVVDEEGVFSVPKTIQSYPYIAVVQTYDIYGNINYTELLVEDPNPGGTVFSTKTSAYDIVYIDVDDEKYTQSQLALEVEAEVLRAVNEIRISYGLGTLEYSEEYEKTAMVKAYDMSEKSYFGHFDEEEFNLALYFGVGENIARDFFSVEDVVNAWMNSEGHKANILNETYTKIGIACYGNKEHNDHNYWVQHFGN